MNRLLATLCIGFAGACFTPADDREVPLVETACDDGIDEDEDGLTDCADWDCISEPCAAPTVCSHSACFDFVCTTRYETGVCRPSRGVCDPEERCQPGVRDCPPDEMAGWLCRDAGPGPCGAAEYCDGVSPECPPDLGKEAGTLCRVAVGLCDVAEVCDGVGAECPADRVLSAGTVCRPTADECDVTEVCDGLGPQCPFDAVADATTVCRPSRGDCDLPDYCNGRSSWCMTDLRVLPGMICREARGECEQPEVCDASSFDCPAEKTALLPAGTVCRAPQAPCDAPEVCDGVSFTCPALALSPASSGTVCGTQQGVCDAVERCDGAGLDCPVDATVAPSTQVCRPKTAECDAEERCDGLTRHCGADALAPSGTLCGAGLACSGDSRVCPSWHQESPPSKTADWRAVWAQSADDVWMVGAGAVTNHWGGTLWTDLPTTDALHGQTPALTAVWASSRDNVWTAGGGFVLAWNGARWTNMDVGLTVSDDPHGIWGFGMDEVWISSGQSVGRWRSDGSWKTDFFAAKVSALWGTGFDDLWAVGGAISHWNGYRWTEVKPPQLGTFYSAIYGSRRDDVWAGTDAGEVAHWDGTAWIEVPNPDTRGHPITGLWTTPGAEVFFTTSTGRVSALDPMTSTWRRVMDASSATYDVSGASASDLWIAGAVRSWHWDGAAWRENVDGTTEDLRSLAIAPVSGAIWAASENQILSGTNGAGWPPFLTPSWLVGIQSLWTAGPARLVVAGKTNAGGTVRPVLATWDGSAWSAHEPAGAPSSLGGSWTYDVWAVGPAGFAAHFDGAAWTEVPTNVAADLFAVASTSTDDAWVAADGGRLLHWNGAAWSSATVSDGGKMVAVTAAPGQAWALQNPSTGGTALWSWDGTTVQQIATAAEELKAIWRQGDGQIWAVGSDQGRFAARRWDGTTWHKVSVEGAGALSAVVGNDQGEVWAAGDGGAILHLHLDP
ncbi:MAG TPA: hypothetical protein VGK67_09255 [Myxococcales bacterium]|jgi:hypothetical protein